MMAQGWAPELAIGGNPNKNQWMAVDISSQKDKQMMLTTDMCLAYRNSARGLKCG